MDTKTMPINSKPKHAKNRFLKKLISIGAAGLIVSTSFVATFSASQAAPITTTQDVYCGENTYTIASDYSSAQIELVGSAWLSLPANDFTRQLANHDDGSLTVTFNDTTTTEITDYDLGTIPVDEITDVEVVTIVFGDAITKSAADTWPITLTYDFGDSLEMDIQNTEVLFDDFSPCTGIMDDAETEHTDDAFDNFGDIKVSGASRFESLRPSVVRKSQSASVTTFTYTVEEFYSDAASQLVDVVVETEFIGNTVTYLVSAFEPGIEAPSVIDFYIEGNLGSDSGTQHSESNGYVYSSDGFTGDPVIVYGTNGIISFPEEEIEDQEDEIKVSFSSTSSGYLEVSLLGYNRCTPEEDVSQALDAFTLAYSTLKNTDLSEVAGDCTRACEPSSSSIEASPGHFDLSGLSLCFDQALNPVDEEGAILNQEVVVEGPDFGNNINQGESIDYQAVAQGADKTLNAILTVAAVNQLYSDEVDEVDSFEFRDNSWINSYVDVVEGDEDRYASYTLVFYEDGDETKTPVSVSNLSLSVYDLDNHQFFESSDVAEYSLSSDSILSVDRPEGNRLRVSENSGTGANSGDESRVSFNLSESSLFTFSMGMTGNDPGNGGAYFGLDFTGQVGWENPPVDRPFAETTNSAMNPVIIEVNPKKVTMTKEIVTLFGAVLGAATHIVVDGQRIEILTKSNNRITFLAPSGLSGSHDITVAFSGFNLVEKSGLVYGQVALIGARKVVPGFAMNKSVLTKTMKKEIRQFLKGNPDYSNVVCKGFTSSPANASDKRLARQRGQEACDYISKRYPELTVRVLKGSHTNQTGNSVRRVQITLR